MYKTTLVLLCSLAFQPVFGQKGSSAKYAPMHPPLNIELVPSGNFAELRSDHFHSGVDLKTNGAIGEPVLAAWDGHVSRIKVSPWGFGNAVYLEHPNGLTTVYAHLDGFNEAITKVALNAHYSQKDASIDLYPDAGTIPVKQGEVIGRGGNSGGSSAPHLHFEVRRTSDQHALDPEAFGLKMKDHTAPQIRGLRIYAMDDTSAVSPYPGRAVGFLVQGAQGKYLLKPGQDPAAYGRIALAVHTRDTYDNSSNLCGIRRLEIWSDGALTFTAVLDEIDFETFRYVNAHTDHALFKGSNMHYHRMFRLPNNKLTIYGAGPDPGVIDIRPGEDRNIEVKVFDASNNLSTLNFKLRGADRESSSGWRTVVERSALLSYDKDHLINGDGMRLYIPRLSLYEDAAVTHLILPAVSNGIGPVHQVGDPLVAVQNRMRLSIEVPSEARKWADKLLIVRVNGSVSAEGGTYEKGSIETSVKRFGNYSLMVDTVAPRIVPIDLTSNMQGRSRFSIKVTDDLSGVDRWTATLDGQWILMTYDPKTDRLTHVFDDRTEGQGKRSFKLTVTDDRGNSSALERTFER